jgi:hypothetical protein
MATLEQEHAIPGRLSLPLGEQRVFAADDGRRARLTGFAGLATAALALVWLAALGAAMLGAGRLPGVPLPRAKQVGRAPDAATRHVSPFVQSLAGRPAAPPAAPTPRRSQPQRLSAEADRVQHPAPPPEVLSNPAQVQGPALPQRGWARQGWTAPPGQTKRDESVRRGNPGRKDAPASTNTTATTRQGGPHSPKKG